MLELFFSEYRSYAQDVLAFSLIAIAFIWGGGPERAAAATWLIVFELGGLFTDFFWPDGRQWDQLDVFLVTEDLVAGICWIAIALYANRNYTLWIAGMQVLAMTAHIARALIEEIPPLTHYVMTVGPGWFILFFLAFGLARHIQRKRKFGLYRDWRTRRPPNGLVGEPIAIAEALSASLGKGAGQSWRDDLK